ncbi:MAG: hypothetical protein ACM3IJ_00180 [Candidatus Levyibacteriota bacterium]
MRVIGRVVLILVLAFFSYQLLFTPDHWCFVDYFNLMVHEAGHLIFMLFGQFLDILAGSAFQIFIPFLFLGYFLRRKEFFNSSVILFWIGDNVINVSRYMMDAQEMALPLLGGDGSIHDWNWLFIHMGLLDSSKFIATSFLILGIMFLISSFVGMVSFTIKSSQE